MNSRKSSFDAKSKRISEACKKTLVSKISLPVCICIPLTLIFVFFIIRNKCGVW